jgi:hypothetical protein
MNIEVIERWSEDDDSIGLKFILPNGGMSAVLYPKEKTIELYEALLNAADYMKKHMVEKNVSYLNEIIPLCSHQPTEI